MTWTEDKAVYRITFWDYALQGDGPGGCAVRNSYFAAGTLSEAVTLSEDYHNDGRAPGMPHIIVVKAEFIGDLTMALDQEGE